MTRIVEQTKETFAFASKTSRGGLHFDGVSVWCNSVELNQPQVRRMLLWLERVDRVMSRIGE